MSRTERILYYFASRNDLLKVFGSSAEFVGAFREGSAAAPAFSGV